MKKFIKRIGVVLLLLSVLLSGCAKNDTAVNDETTENEVRALDLNG